MAFRYEIAKFWIVISLLAGGDGAPALMRKGEASKTSRKKILLFSNYF